DRVLRIANRAYLGRAYRKRIAKSKRIYLCLGKSITDLVLDVGGERVVGLKASGHPLEEPNLRARGYVLACGGLRSTCLLLALQAEWPQHFGGTDGPLGRYYMGHLAGEIATIVFNAPGEASEFLIRPDAEGVFALRQFLVKAERQMSDR